MILPSVASTMNQQVSAAARVRVGGDRACQWTGARSSGCSIAIWDGLMFVKGCGRASNVRSDVNGLLNLPSDVRGRLSERISLGGSKVQAMRGRRAVFILYINYLMLHQQNSIFRSTGSARIRHDPRRSAIIRHDPPARFAR